MTVSILRTADAWWVQTPTGAARITTAAATTRELLPDRAAIQAAAHSSDTVPGGGTTDQLRLPCQRRRAQPGNHPTGLLPQGIRLHQRPIRRHHQTRPCPVAGLLGRD